MKFSTTILLIFVTTLSFSQKKKVETYDFNKKYPLEKLQRDLKILKEALVKSHPGLYWYQTKEEFETAYKKLYDSLPKEMTEFEFLEYTFPFVSNVRCGHTALIGSKEGVKYFEEKSLWFPFSLWVFDGKIFIRKNLSDDSVFLPGTEILAINRIPVKTILGKMLEYSWTDGYSLPGEYTRLEDADYFALFLQFIFGQASSYTLTMTLPEGSPSSREVAALSYKQIAAWNVKRYSEPGKPGVYNLKIVDSNTAVITILAFEGKGYKKFLETSFRKIKDIKTKNLIIDLRENTGGNDDYGSLLYSYIALDTFLYYNHLEIAVDNRKDPVFKYAKVPISIWLINTANMKRKNDDGSIYLKNSTHSNLKNQPFKPKKNAFRGKVYILISGHSFSATTEFASVAHAHRRATFIGQETGGAYRGNCSGEWIPFTLPNTGIRIIIPMIGYYGAVSSSYPNGSGIKPDYLVCPSIPFLLEKKDMEMDAALKLITNPD
jgi:hypothetical protein